MKGTMTLNPNRIFGLLGRNIQHSKVHCCGKQPMVQHKEPMSLLKLKNSLVHLKRPMIWMGSM